MKGKEKIAPGPHGARVRIRIWSRDVCHPNVWWLLVQRLFSRHTDTDTHQTNCLTWATKVKNRQSFDVSTAIATENSSYLSSRESLLSRMNFVSVRPCVISFSANLLMEFTRASSTVTPCTSATRHATS